MANYRLRIGFPSGYALTASFGSYILTGRDAALTYTAGGGNTVTASFTASRTSGTGPMAVIFDATATSSNVTKVNLSANGTAYRQVQYDWSFGDSGSGNWTNSGLPKNTQTGGPIAAYCYDPTATGVTNYTASLTVTVGLPWGTNTSAAPRAYIVNDIVTQSGNTYYCSIANTPGTFATDLAGGKWTLLQVGLIQHTTTQNIAVTDANTTYAGTNTIYVSKAANYAFASGKGWVTQNTVPAPVNGKRIMLRAGETGYGDINISSKTNCQVVSDGQGAKPGVGRLNITGTNNCFKGVSASLGITGFDGTDNLALGNTIAHSDVTAVTLYIAPNVGGDPYAEYIRPAAFGNTIPGNSTSDYGIFCAGHGMMIVDNTVGGVVQHTMRCYSDHLGYIAHNQLDGGTIDSTKLSFKHHALGLVQYPTAGNGNHASGYVVMTNNTMGKVGSTQVWIADNCPENFDSTTVEGLEYFIYENNILVTAASTTTHFLTAGRQMTHRGNSCTSGSYIYSDVSNASGAGGVVGSSNSTYRNNWVNQGTQFLG